jgi:hypothetical protein
MIYCCINCWNIVFLLLAILSITITIFLAYASISAKKILYMLILKLKEFDSSILIFKLQNRNYYNYKSYKEQIYEIKYVKEYFNKKYEDLEKYFLIKKWEQNYLFNLFLISKKEQKFLNILKEFFNNIDNYSIKLSSEEENKKKYIKEFFENFDNAYIKYVVLRSEYNEQSKFNDIMKKIMKDVCDNIDNKNDTHYHNILLLYKGILNNYNKENLINDLVYYKNIIFKIFDTYDIEKNNVFNEIKNALNECEKSSENITKLISELHTKQNNLSKNILNSKYFK